WRLPLQEYALKAVETLKDYQFSEGLELRPSLAKGNLTESKQEYAPVPQPMMSWDYSSYVPLASRANGTNAPCDTLFLRDISVTEAQVQSVAASL
ncbi:hypothetical protein CYMTET_33078, partial [Cymbomonas tetramitiformis]